MLNSGCEQIKIVVLRKTSSCVSIPQKSRSCKEAILVEPTNLYLFSSSICNHENP